ncbi:hypothetical protein QBC37DRAFT_403059 [Rhypophila decipiens]|uniref:Vitelline envelope sperm lysin receptor n=1 Tax=Rhypophila decipiens TaxID=261697 RepID=A0AAN6Y3P4_9PEZI|nr:hypothetical protein QBC37DRAFT_403059 [Rhypophila decipiens]
MSSFTKSILLVVLALTSATAAQGLNLFCVDKSYRTSPLLWTLENLQYSSRVKIGSFRLTNKQSDYSTLIYCDTGLCRPAPDDDSNPAGDGQGYLGSNITGTVNLTGGMANVAFNQTWTCDNHDISIVFPFKYVAPILRIFSASPNYTLARALLTMMPTAPRPKFTGAATTQIPVQCESSTGRCTGLQPSYTIAGSLLSADPPGPYMYPSIPKPRAVQPAAASCQPPLPSPKRGDQIWTITAPRYSDMEIPCTPGVEIIPAPSYCYVNGIAVEFSLLNNLLKTSTTCKGMLKYWYPYNVTSPPPAAGPEIRCDLKILPNSSQGSGTEVVVRRLQTWATVTDASPGLHYSAKERVLNVQVEQAWGCGDDDGWSS